MLANQDRLLVSTVRQLAAERGVEVASFAGDWILRLSWGGWTEHIVGYVFPLNSAGARAVSADKVATAELLEARGVPCVAHHLVLRPDLAPYVGEAGNWAAIRALGERNGWDLVVKPNEGTGGEDVVRVRGARELEAAVHDGLVRHRALALSPFHEIETEYRAVLLDDDVLLTYAKARPAVVGDGVRSVGALAEAAGLDASAVALDVRRRVPGEGEQVLLDWRHNLQLGSVPRPIESAEVRDEVERLAAAAAGTLGLRFASVDVVETADGLAVLEANAGVMLEAYARAVPDGAATARRIYGAALDALLAP
ncbi:ATP-grasp domain-containing protein [Rubrivirga marina]|uniref:ATP-grasp domain-containing protein n=1 Tax=Rubrivirga marina TaxID=1196024 RepID=A0A271IZI1_9BACT|nr:RimK-like protein [Rubrivirga marina]PAP76398.1 hypothetical protein BSZ37_08045 [Rubrivirga marina]